MGCRSSIFCSAFFVIAQALGQVPLFGISPYTAVYPINPALRGSDLVQMFQTLDQISPYSTTNSEVGLVLSDGTFIPFVQNIAQSSFNTYLIITYRTTKTGNTAQNIYLALPVEQISEMIYSNTTIPVASNGSSLFSASVPSNVLPYYSINISERASDIQSIVYQLINTFPYNTLGNQIVSLQTTLSGPYYAPFTNGLIPDVKSVSLSRSSNRTLMIVTYQVANINKYIVVSPEQVTSINYSPR